MYQSMKKSDIKQLPEFYKKYILLNPDEALEQAFVSSIHQIESLDIQKLKRIGLQVYADGKWTIPTILQHLIDWERIFCYRTLIAVRNLPTIPEAHDENYMATQTTADALPIEQLIDELHQVRLSTQALFAGFTEEKLQLNCKFHTQQMSVLAMGFSILGHQIHHFNILQQRYFPLDTPS